MNQHERERIAAAMHHLRPDWPLRQLLTLLATPQLTDRPRRDVVVALAWVACESNTASPYRVLESGPWWRAAAIDEPGSRQREPGPWCSVCGQPMSNHRATDHEPTVQRHEKRSPEAMRLIVQDARQHIHGGDQ